MTDVEWPADFERTPARDRSKNRSYEVSLAQAIDDLEAELDRLGVDDWRLETNMEHQSRNPKRPYANQPKPDDPSVVVRWRMDGEQYAVACDAYSRVRDNLRTIGLYIHEKRKMDSRPVTTGESEFANARLPPADDDAIVVADGSTAAPHEVLNVAPEAPADVVEAAARRLKAEAHPDAGGSRAEFQRIVAAEEAMLDD
ncbi:molecular chaperone DnaJ [Halalkaliarchaeum desulfuricum]|uniref:Molecular chaperone DnaJ n=1 Tax=Halalkaliarchaeum desulfuricum TaxID=2055893 RepID=A0A343TJP5_9EURY|nr:J domain-containing protein [Halalkaliarchaeum desulfuricum]AUX09317.1 molecular chaperone DnaJ [Halalkaliarchaeum desulfuricum]